jgi:tetratricopeptide (TPR) repeat protein
MKRPDCCSQHKEKINVHKIFATILLIITVCLSGCKSFPDEGTLNPFRKFSFKTEKQGRTYAHHIAGIISERQGSLKNAVANYTRVIQHDPTAVTPRLRLIRSYLRLGNLEQAMASCEKALEQIPDSPELWIVYAQINRSMNNNEAALRAIEKIIALRPDDPSAYGALVEQQELMNDLVSAIEVYEKLLELSPNSAALYYQMGITLTRIGDYPSAKESFIRVLQLEPQITRAWFFLALVLFDLGEYVDCETCLQMYLLVNSNDFTSFDYLAATQFRLGRSVEAEETLSRLINSENTSPANYLQMAWILFFKGDMERSQQYALEGKAYLFADLIFALANFDQVEAAYGSTNPWDDRYSLEEVEAEADLILRTLPALFGKEEVPELLQSKLSLLREKFGFSPILEFLQGRLLLYSNKHEEALLCFKTVLAHSKETFYPNYHCATIYEKLNDIAAAETHLLRCLKVNPDDADIQNFLGYLYAENTMKLEEAEKLIGQALSVDPENPYYLDSMGWVYYKQGKSEKAADYVRRALYGMDTDDAVLREHLGDIYFQQGKRDQALVQWRHALRLDPSLESVLDKIKHNAEAAE